MTRSMSGTNAGASGGCRYTEDLLDQLANQFHLDHRRGLLTRVQLLDQLHRLDRISFLLGGG